MVQNQYTISGVNKIAQLLVSLYGISSIFAIFCRRHALMAFKHGAEIPGIRESAAGTDFCDGNVSMPQQVFCFTQTAVGQIFCRPHMHGFFKNPAQMLGRNACQLSQNSDRKIFGEVVVNIIENRHQLLTFVGAPVGAFANSSSGRVSHH